MIGQVISHYRILRQLGEGGMGVVYAAEDILLRRQVAFKLIKFSDSDDPQKFKKSFLREARLASTINHPNIAAVYDYGEGADGTPFMVMELLAGQSLAELLREKPLPLKRSLKIIRQVAAALKEAHRHGIIHRDIKPSNIIVNERDEAKVLDFGLARRLEVYGSAETALSDFATRSMTQTFDNNSIAGTPLYLSPEQALCLPLDSRSDFFSLGSVLYECVIGRPAFDGNNFIEICVRVVKEELSPPSELNPFIPPALDDLILKALAKKADDRFQTADELIANLADVEAVLNGEEIPLRRPSPLTEAKTQPNLPPLQLSGWWRNYGAALSVAVLLVALVAAINFNFGFKSKSVAATPGSPEANRWFVAGTLALREGNYFKAGKLLQEAVAHDDQFSPAHAGLAEVWTELDYEDKAAAALARVNELTPALDKLPERDALRIQAVTAGLNRDYAAATAKYEELWQKAPPEEKAFTAFDFGRALEKADQTNRAIEIFEEAARLDPQYAAAFTRLGILYNRIGETKKAEKAFEQAQTLYRMQSNYDGEAEVFYQRGTFFNQQDKLPEARTQLERALELSTATANRPLQISSLLNLGSVANSASDFTLAQQNNNDALEIARTEHLENLLTAGFLEIGSVYLLRGEYKEAEKNFRQALDSAKFNRQSRIEAYASLSLGSLYAQQGKSLESINQTNPALIFFRQNNYYKEIVQALLALGYANNLLGNYDSALSNFEQQQRLGKSLNDNSIIASAEAAIGLVMIHKEHFSAALEHFEESYRLNQSLGLEPKTGYDLLNMGQASWQIGDYKKANYSLSKVLVLAGNLDKSDRQLQAWAYLLKGEIALSRQNNERAASDSQKAIDLTGGQIPEIEIRAMTTQGVSLSRSGKVEQGRKLCQQTAERALQTGIVHLIGETQVALAETFLADKQAQASLDSALKIADTFARLEQKHSQWRALAIAAQASFALSDKTLAASYAAQAKQILFSLETIWGADNFHNYLSRRDTRFYQAQLKIIN